MAKDGLNLRREKEQKVKYWPLASSDLCFFIAESWEHLMEKTDSTRQEEKGTRAKVSHVTESFFPSFLYPEKSLNPFPTSAQDSMTQLLTF